MICQLCYFICYFELKKQNKTGNGPLPCPKQYQKIALGIKWSFRERTVGRRLGNSFHVPSQVLFKAGVVHLHHSFLFMFMSSMNPCTIVLNVNWWASLFLPCSIAMATKENMTSQRGMLKSIQSKMNTLASILFDGLKSVFRGENLCVLHHSLPPLGRLPSVVTVEVMCNSVLWICPALVLCESSYCLVPFLKDSTPEVSY